MSVNALVKLLTLVGRITIETGSLSLSQKQTATLGALTSIKPAGERGLVFVVGEGHIYELYVRCPYGERKKDLVSKPT